MGLTELHSPEHTFTPFFLFSPYSLPPPHSSLSSFTEESNESQTKYNKVSKSNLNPLKNISHSQREDQGKKENTVRLDVNLMTMMTDFLVAKLKKETRTPIHLIDRLLRSDENNVTIYTAYFL